MKFSTLLAAGVIALAPLTASAATDFSAADGNINFSDLLLPGGFQLYMVDNADQSSLLVLPDAIYPTTAIIGIADIGVDQVAVNAATTAMTLDGPDPTFRFGLSNDAATFVFDSVGIQTGPNRYSLTYKIGGQTTIVDVQQVPVPAAAWLFGSGLIGLAGIARRKKATA